MTESVLEYEFKAQNLRLQEPLKISDFLNILNVLSFEGVDGEVAATFFLTLVILFAFLKALLKYLLKFQAECVESSRVRTTDGSVNDVQPIQTTYDPEEPCPICYEVIVFPVKTNCRHVFCGECMLVLLQSANLKRIVCPMCRLKVRMIQPISPVGQPHSGDISNLRVLEIIEELEDYNVWFSDCNLSFLRNIQRCPAFFRRLRRSLRNLDIFDLNFYNRMGCIKSVIFSLYVAVQLVGLISKEDVRSFSSVVFSCITVTVAAHSVMILVRRFTLRN